MRPFDERLLYNNLEITICRAAITNYRQGCFGKIGIVQGDTVKCEYGLNKIIKADGLDERGPMVEHHGFPTFGNLFAQQTRKRLVYAVSPTANGFCPPFYA